MRYMLFLWLSLCAAVLILTLAATRAHALDVTFVDAAGNTTTITDNGPADNNPAPGVIDFRISLAGVNFTAFGRAEEVIVGARRLVRLTETPGQPAQGYYQNTSRTIPAVVTVTVNSTAFAAVPAGVAWTVNYVGETFDGPFPGTRVPCPGNGAVTIPTHNVAGLLNGGAVRLGTVNGPVYINAGPQGFATQSQGLTPAAATALQLVWMLDPDPCDGIRLPSSAEVILEPGAGDDLPPDPPPPPPPYEPWWIIGLILLILLLIAFLWYARHRKRKGGHARPDGGISP